MTDTATRLAGPTQLTTSAATVYTVPGSTTTIVKHIVFTNDNASDRTVILSVGVDASATRILSSVNVPGKGVFNWDTWIVLDAAEVLQAYASAASSVNLTISGVEVS